MRLRDLKAAERKALADHLRTATHVAALAQRWQRFLDGDGPLPNPAASRTFKQRRNMG
jgi:hypothetical protein